MKDLIKERVYQEAYYIIKTKKTLRELSKVFNISKSTIHKDLKDRLKNVDISLYKEVQLIFQNHIETRHIKGGEMTKKKYQKKHYSYSNKDRYDIIF